MQETFENIRDAEGEKDDRSIDRDALVVRCGMTCASETTTADQPTG